MIKSSPFNHLVSSTIPSAPLITKVEATDADEAVIFFNPPASDGGSPVYYYTVISNPGLVTVLSPQSGSGSITVTGLTKATTYTFTLTAHNINGSSAAGTSPAPITTLAEKIVRVSPTSSSSSNAPTLAAPAFTLSSSSQSVLVNNTITTVTNTSTGGAIASYAISPAAPSGLSFSTSTGQLSGTPTSTQSATNYTITATNAAGSATATFTLTVSAPAPAFSLSSTAETRVATTAITGYTITSTGAPITSYAISPTPPSPLTFETSTGRIAGTPSETRTATTYTITGTSASGETATATFRLRVTGDIGDTGPGGGTIFYTQSSFNCGPLAQQICRYLEVAPANWNGAGIEQTSWAQAAPIRYNNRHVGDTGGNLATGNFLGLGLRNTRAIVAQGNTDTLTSVAAIADSYTTTVSGVVYDDWYIPSAVELNQMCKWARNQAWVSIATQCDTSGLINSGPGASGFGTLDYWSSTESAADSAKIQNFSSGIYFDKLKSLSYRIRPIRSF